MSNERAMVGLHRGWRRHSLLRVTCIALAGALLVVGWPAAALGGTAPHAVAGAPVTQPAPAPSAATPSRGVFAAPGTSLELPVRRAGAEATSAGACAPVAGSHHPASKADPALSPRGTVPSTTGGPKGNGLAAGAQRAMSHDGCTTSRVTGPRGGFLPTPVTGPQRVRDATPTRKTPSTPKVSLAAATFAISGTVTGPGGTPLEGISVEADSDLYWSDAYTAADGTFSVPVTADAYIVSFTDWSQANTSGWYGSGGFVLLRADATAVVVSTASVTHVDAELPLNHFVTGTITAQGGAPLENIVVAVSSGGYSETGWTMADGTYAVGVPSGTYTVGVYDETNVYATGYWTAGGFTRDAASASPVVVTTADLGGIDLTLPKNPRITGKVTNAAGAGIASIDVMAEATTGRYAVSTATTAADGTYVLPVEPSTYTVNFSDYKTVYASGYYATTGFTADFNAASTVTVASTDVTGINVTLPKALHIKGKLTGPGGVGASGVYLSANGTDGNFIAQTGVTGTYSIAVSPGIYQLQVEDGNSPATYPSGFYRSSGFTLNPGAATGLIVTTADVTANLQLPKMVLIKGKVTGPGGVALAGIAVQSSARFPGSAAVTSATGTYSLPVPASGNWSIQFYDRGGVYTSGFYRSSGFTRDANSATSVAVTTTTVTAINVQLPKNLRITGKVTRAGGIGIPNVSVYADGVTYGEETNTAADGTFSIGVPAGSYAVSFQTGSDAYAGGYYGSAGYSVDTPKTVTVSTANVTGVSVQLPILSVVSGSVMDEGSTGLAGIAVYAEGDHYSVNPGYGQATTAADGSYSLHVAPGTYRVAYADPDGVHAPAYYAGSGATLVRSEAQRLSIGSGTTSGIDVHLGLNHLLEGTVTKPGGQGVADARVYAFSTVWADATSTGADGSYSIAVPPGDYGVEFLSPGSYNVGYYSSTGMVQAVGSATAVSVTASDVSGVDAELASTHRIRGRVTGAGVAGLPAVSVCAESSTQSQCGETAADGTYALSVPAGAYAVSFDAGAGWYSMDNAWGGMFSSGYYAGTGFKLHATQATAVNVSAADVTGIDVVLPRNLLVSGRVTAPNGVGVAGITVFGLTSDARVLGATGADGRYSLDVPAGSYTILYDSWYTGSYPYGWYGSSGFTSTTPKKVTVTTANVTGISVILPKPVWIKGRVTGPAGGGMAGVEVTAETSAGYGTGLSTDDAGRFALVVAAGTYTVSYEDNWGWLLGQRSPSGYYSSTGFKLAVGSATKVVVGTSSITLATTALPAARVISGFVTGANKLPLGDVAVSASNGLYSVTGSTDGQGAYALPVPDGSFKVFFEDPAGLHTSGYYSTGGLTPDAASASVVPVAGADVGTIDVVLPLDTAAPTTTAPALSLRKGAAVSGSSLPVTLTWTGSDGPDGGGIARYELSRSTDGGTTWTVTPIAITAPTYATTVTAAGTVIFRVAAVDMAGNVGLVATGPILTPRLVQQTSSTVTYGGTWSSASSTHYSGGSVKYTGTAGRSASYKFTGRSIALVTTRASTRGSVKVYVDGVLSATVSCHATTTTYRVLVWQKTWTTSAIHTVKLVVVGTAGHPRVDLDAFSVVR